MHFRVATKLAVTNGVMQFSNPLQMSGNNTFRFAVVVYNLGGATGITITPQGTVDGENWRALTATGSLGLGASSFSQAAITDEMVRLQYATDGTGTVILAVDCWTSQQRFPPPHPRRPCRRGLKLRSRGNRDDGPAPDVRSTRNERPP